MKLANTMKYVRVGLLAASTALFLAGPVSAQSGTDNAANSGANGAAVGTNGTVANPGDGTATGAATVNGTSQTGNAANTGTGAFPYNNNPYNYTGRSAGGYGLWGLLGLIGLFGLLRGGRSRVTPSTPTYTRTEEYSRPRA
jgi:hypothetical protein